MDEIRIQQYQDSLESKHRILSQKEQVLKKVKVFLAAEASGSPRAGRAAQGADPGEAQKEDGEGGSGGGEGRGEW